MKRIVVAAMMAAFCLGVVAPAYAVRDYSSTALNIIPSGQWGAVPAPPQANDQAAMYDALTPLFDNVTNPCIQKPFTPNDLATVLENAIQANHLPLSLRARDRSA